MKDFGVRCFQKFIPTTSTHLSRKNWEGWQILVAICIYRNTIVNPWWIDYYSVIKKCYAVKLTPRRVQPNIKIKLNHIEQVQSQVMFPLLSPRLYGYEIIFAQIPEGNKNGDYLLNAATKSRKYLDKIKLLKKNSIAITTPAQYRKKKQQEEIQQYRLRYST